jgi:hypothetical protein
MMIGICDSEIYMPTKMKACFIIETGSMWVSPSHAASQSQLQNCTLIHGICIVDFLYRMAVWLYGCMAVWLYDCKWNKSVVQCRDAFATLFCYDNHFKHFLNSYIFFL